MKKRYTCYISSVCITLIAFLLMPSGMSAQVLITDSVNLESLINDVLLDGDLTAFNLTYNGVAYGDDGSQSNQYGTFEIVNSAFPISEGVILATAGVSSFGGGFGFQDDNFQNDPDLMALSGGFNMNNCAIIEFDLVAASDTFLIDYIFASDEYPGFTCTQFNDVFGLFISGPGLEGPFLNDAINIALIPDTYIPIGVNTVNAGYPSNSANDSYCLDANPNYQEDAVYFMSNNPPLPNSISTPGHTHMFTAFASLIPGQTYHVKFAIANAVDNALQSAVFLRKGSVSSMSGLNPLEISVNPDNIEIAPEGLFIAGTFNYFVPEPMTLNADGTYSFEAMVPADVNVTYKFYNGNGPDANELVQADCGIEGAMSDLSRYLIMPNEPLSLETVCFGACDNACSVVSSSEITDVRKPGIFPNPTAGTVQIVLPQTGIKQLQVEIFDLTGKMVLQRNTVSATSEIYTLDIGSLRSGVYMMQIIADGVLRTEKLVKQ